GGDPLGQTTSSVVTLSGNPSIQGIACDGTRIFVNSSSTEIHVYDLQGTLLGSHAVTNLATGNNQMAFANGYLFARNGDTLYRISTADWTSTEVLVDASHPMLTCASWMNGSLFDTPDGRLGIMGPTSLGHFTIRFYQVSNDGLTLTWERDLTLNDPWIPDEHGMACDGTLFYRMSMTEGCKVYDLETGEVIHNGSDWDLHAAAFGGAILNPTWLTRNHRTGALIAGDYQADRLLIFTPDHSIHFTVPENMTYDGYAKDFVASTTGLDTFTYSYEGTGTTSYGPTSEAPVGAGTYRITATSADANYTGSRTLSFTITAAALPEPAWHVFPPASLEYDGTAKTFMALAGGAGPSPYSSTVFSYLYEGQNGTSYAATTTAPTQVGNYRLTTTASGNYTGWRQT
ncbi:MAG: hypothetical protein EBZ07_08565, partial [Verrucomicrobia bacterium]|nr:hypothetical protein [Verrucomicrobiota bacterium]